MWRGPVAGIYREPGGRPTGGHGHGLVSPASGRSRNQPRAPLPRPPRFCEPELPVSAGRGDDLGSLSKRNGDCGSRVACDVTWVSETPRRTDVPRHLWMQVKKNIALKLAFEYSYTFLHEKERI